MTEIVGAGDLRVRAHEGRLAVLGLGSCVVVILYDKISRVGGLAHVLLPDPSYSTTPDRREMFATTAIPDLVSGMEEVGAHRSRIEARLVGGASMFRELLSPERPNIGDRNVSAARDALEGNGIPIIGEDVGGSFGRSVHFDVKDGQVRVSSARSDEHIV